MVYKKIIIHLYIYYNHHNGKQQIGPRSRSHHRPDLRGEPEERMSQLGTCKNKPKERNPAHASASARAQVPQLQNQAG